MSDVYPFTDSDAEPSPAAFAMRNRQAASMTALNSLDASPEDAGRAQDLSEATGTPPVLVYGDLENFEKQHKAAITASLFAKNQYLRDYVQSHPLAAKVSNDDWGQLDQTSEALQKLAIGPKIVDAAMQGWKEGVGGESFGPAYKALMALFNPIPTIAKTIVTGQMPDTGPKMVSTALSPISRGVSGIANAVVQGGAEWLHQQFGWNRNEAERNIGGFAEFMMADTAGHGIEVPHEMVQRGMELHDAAQPWVEQGKVPPVGVANEFDQFHKEQAKEGMKALDDAMSEVQKSSTRERSPELMQAFIQQHTNAEIGIDAAAVRKLYGDKEPAPDDNLLGFVPGLGDQLRLAEAHGGDVNVPLADWLAKVDPEVAKELHDNIRVRDGGMTLEEAKGEAKPEQAKEPVVEDEIGAGARPQSTPVVDPAVQALRDSTHLAEPLLTKLPQSKGIVPEQTEIGEVGVEGGSIPARTFPASDALAQVDKNRLTGVPRALAEFFSDRLQRMAGDTPVWLVDPEIMDQFSKDLNHPKGTPGFYHSGEHAIVMRGDYAQGAVGHSYAAHLLIHEVAHAATVREMEEFPELKGAVHDMLMETSAWLSDHEPQARVHHDYAFKNEHEFIAEAFSNPAFQEQLATTPISKELAEKLGLRSKVKANVWDAVRGIVKNLISKLTGIKSVPDTILDGVLRLGPTFEEAQKRMKGDREGVTAAAKVPEQGELDVTRTEDKELFDKANAIGLTEKQYARYMGLIEKRNAEDIEHQKAQTVARERERQTGEWKTNLARVHGEAQESIHSRPDIAADRFLREGHLYGEKIERRRLDETHLTPEQKAGLDPEHYSKSGLHPDDAAGLFGYTSGDRMVGQLGRLKQDRELEGLTPAAHLKRLVDVETERRMKAEYGNLEENILNEAKDNVLTQTQLDLLHEEILALGSKAGGEISISKDDVKQWVKTEFNKTPLAAIDSDKYLAAAGRAGRTAEEALLAEKPQDAFKAKQQQYISVLLANEARRLEKERTSFERTAKRFSKREVAGVPGEYTNWIHDILQRVGQTVRRSVQDLQEAVGRESADTLEKFVQGKNQDASIWEQDENAPSDFQVMPVAPFLFDPAYRKTIDEMTPDEFRAVHNSIKTLEKNGKDENKIVVAGNKQDLQAVLDQMTGQLKDLFGGDEKQYAFGHKDQGVGHVIRTYWASLLQIESIFNRFDKGDPKGIFRKAITQPIFEGSHILSTLETKYSRMYKELDFPSRDLKKRVDNPLFGDPLRDGEMGPMNRGNLLAVLQNVGNPSQLDKLARGYGIKDQSSIMQWLFQHTTKEDWDRAQKLGDIFKSAFEESATMYHNLSGVAPEKIDIRPIQTPFGTYDGWYHPIVYDPLRPGSSKKLMGQDPLQDGSYYRAATPSGYTKRRTGYAAPINLNFEAVPNKLKSILNDIAMRPAITEAAKVFYDPKWQMAITKYYGKEIKDLMIPYLKDIAGQKTYKDAAQSAATRYLEYARQNVTATLIGLNPSTVLKHGPTAAMLSIKEVGAGNFLREVTSLLSMNDDLGERNWNFAMKGGIVDGEQWNGSEELQRRHRNWQETLSGAQQDVFGENTLRNSVIKLGATPVAISDLLSAVPTWLASYKSAIRDGAEHGDAVQLADTSVRRAHGSSATAARPRIMRGGPLAQFATPFYTFFNEMFQRQYEMAWRAKDAVGEANEGNYKEGLKEVPNLAKGLWAYVVFPAMIEQMVSPWVTGKQSTAETIALAGLRGVASSLPGIRDLVEAFLGGRDPTIGMYSTSAKMLVDMGRDLSKGKQAFSRENAGNLIKHTVTAFGAMTGLANAQMGRTGEYVYKVATGAEHPKDTGDLLRGLWHGTQKVEKR